MQTDKTGVNGADPAENQTPSYSAEVELEGNEVNPWPYSCSIMQCKLCLPRETDIGGSRGGPGGASAPVTTSLDPLVAPLNVECEIIFTKRFFRDRFLHPLLDLLDRGNAEQKCRPHIF